jgi:hypothetical protein
MRAKDLSDSNCQKVARQSAKAVAPVIRELTKPDADHVENIIVRSGDPFNRTGTHRKSEKKQT